MRRIVLKNEDICGHMSALTKQTHIIDARVIYCILINDQHITGENILDGDR